MEKQGATSGPGKASGLKPPSKIARPSGAPSKTSPSSGKELLRSTVCLAISGAADPLSDVFKVCYLSVMILVRSKVQTDRKAPVEVNIL